jgi:hypothetical protein
MQQHNPMEDRVRLRAYELWQKDGSPDGGAEYYWHRAEQDITQDEMRYDTTVEDSMPASDPPSNGALGGAISSGNRH